MAQPVARIGDIGMGTCPCHKNPQTIVGTIVIGSPTVSANNLGRARIGDLVMCSCGHVATLVMGSSTVFANSIPQSRLGDMFMGCPTGTIVVGSPTVLVG